MKRLLIALVVVVLVVLTTTTAFASADATRENKGQGVCTEQCSAEGTGQMNRWQHRNQKMMQWAEPAMGSGRGSGSQECDQCAAE